MALDWCGWWASHSRYITQRERAPCKHWIEPGWVPELVWMLLWREISCLYWESNVKSTLMICFVCDFIVSIRTLFPMAEQLNSIVTGSSYKVWGGMTIRNMWNCGTIKTAWFTTTLQLHLLLCQSRNFRLLKTWLCSPLPLYCPAFMPYDFFLILRMKSQLWGHLCQDVLKFRNNHWPSYMHFQKGQFQWYFQQ